MSDAEQNSEVVEKEEVQELDYKALYEETQKKLDTVAQHKDKLYAETKKAKADRETAENEAKRIADETAKKNGEFEKLWKQTSQERDELSNRIEQLSKGYRQEKLDVTAMRVATELADGDNAELLSNFIKTSLDSLADDTGSLKDDVIKSVTSEFKNNPKYKALLRTSKAIGGGAPGSASGASEAKVISRDQFDKYDAGKKMAFVKSGGRLTDNLN